MLVITITVTVLDVVLSLTLYIRSTFLAS